MSPDRSHLSLWWDSVASTHQERQPLDRDLDVDVAIVGGGFTGLWTARSLLVRDPSLNVAIIERETCGYGASGRNGGWASALFAVHDTTLARQSGRQAALDMRAAMNDSVDEISRAAAADGIECDFQKGGTIVAARSAAQVARAQEEVAEARELGFGSDDLRWMDVDEAREHLGATDVLGATYTPHCAAINPAKLCVGLADAVERRGASIFESTAVTEIRPGGGGRRPAAVTARGTITADVVVRATEGFSVDLPGSSRAVIPVYSLMIATEPLSDEIWAQIGLEGRPTFADHRHLVIYGQRTADGRIAFGGRGAPYHYNSTIDPSFDRDARVFAHLRASLVELFPILAETLITHTWGGPLGIPRDWYSSVGLDRTTGMAWAGGYVGDGVTTTNLAGRTLADLITGEETELTRLAWVNHQSPQWEPEPLRWLGVNAGLLATRWSDHVEATRGRPSWVASKMARLIGG